MTALFLGRLVFLLALAGLACGLFWTAVRGER